MNLFEVQGTVTALGQSMFDNDVAVYAYITITDDADRRTVIEKAAVCNDVGSVLALGQSGTFYVDRLFTGRGAVRCQLWGLRCEGHAVIDRQNLRSQAATFKILWGIAALPLLGLGLIFIASGIRLMMGDNDRLRFFRGSANVFPPPLPVQAVRI